MANIVLSFLLFPNSHSTLVWSAGKPAAVSRSRALFTFLSIPSTPTLLPSFRVTMRIPRAGRKVARGRTSSLSVSLMSRLASQTIHRSLDDQSDPTRAVASWSRSRPSSELNFSALQARWDTLVRLSTEDSSMPGSTARTETWGDCLARKPVQPPGAAPTSTTRRGPDWKRWSESSSERSCRASAILSSALLKLRLNVGSLSPSPGRARDLRYCWPV